MNIRAYYHVINRGNRRERVFTCDSDYKLFIEKLVYFANVYEIEIHGYCLMPNHFHLQLRTLHANLGKFMQSFMTSFTLLINRKSGKSGHLFQGRYKAQLVESELYKNKLSRYIHLNPVKVQAMEGVTFEVKKKYLRDFRWSSFRMFKCTLTMLADKFELSISGLNMAVHRFKLQLQKDKKIQKIIAGLCKAIEGKCNNV